MATTEQPRRVCATCAHYFEIDKRSGYCDWVAPPAAYRALAAINAMLNAYALGQEKGRPTVAKDYLCSCWKAVDND